MKHVMDWDEFDMFVECLCERVERSGGYFKDVYGIPRGGCFVAYAVSKRLKIPVTDIIGEATLVVDDLIDSGSTVKKLRAAHKEVRLVEALITKGIDPCFTHIPMVEGWVVFPWEAEKEDQGPEDAVTRLLTFIGEDPNRDGLRETPRRVVKALAELTVGYAQDPEVILSKRFQEKSDELILVSPIEFNSLCEHHMLPFTGIAAVGYIPGESVVGLSKIPRLVECFARRLQIQERMTSQIAEAMQSVLSPIGVGVVVEARHTCMCMRGVQKKGVMTTSCFLGAFRNKPEARAEFLALMGRTR